MEFIEWITWFFDNNSSSQCRTLVFVTWAIWTEQNKWLVEAVTWRPPENSIVRINFDAFLKKHENRSCSGMIIRNLECDVLGSKRLLMRIDLLFSQQKALACIQSLMFGLDLGLLEVEIEGDVLTVIRKLRDVSEDKSEIRAFIKDGKRLSRCFHTHQFQHVRRSANGVAHLLATESLKQGFQLCMRDGVPDFARDEVDKDRS
ncbi:hypothetical protein CXB51_025728 [Gossypium anomalum]|uniref:RNase H type-1 domain-containing protein n=1 Tax=Gossypium anomalum TaxID=47600 RepID=A0A8J6CSL8_9ROSI|nr:hypothetical protein CXB51_025728 [Gossypium anomalum]